MKTKTHFALGLLVLSTINCPLSTFAQGTAFTYQGRLNDGGNAANGSYDLTFTLFTTNITGVAIAGPVTNSATAVSNGLFIATIDFGPGIFTGGSNWLEIAVETNGAGSFTNLAPRQQLTPVPYAITAENLNGTVASNGLAGSYGSAVTLNNAANQFSGTFTGNGSGLTNLNVATLGGLASTNFWQTGGNAGTSPGANFVGTTDNQPLELRVNGQRAFRLTPDGSTNDSPNVIGGSPVNAVGSGLVGATIGGGGAIIYGGLPGTNLVLGDFNTIAGGWGNTTGNTNYDVSEATIAGGAQNTAAGISSAIGGGAFNLTYDNNAVVAGGLQNRAGYHAFVGSGYNNSADGVEATIGGGRQNNIQTNAAVSVIGGGFFNTIQGNNYDAGATIGGGGENTIQVSSVFDGNGPFGSSSYSTIGGGFQNLILTNSPYSTIAGGRRNTVEPNDPYATIGGGDFNTNGGFASSIGGGQQNNTSGGDGAVIGGGYSNSSSGSAATVGGGQNNSIGIFADHATISGGGGNSIVGSAALPVFGTIGGGNSNSIQTNTSYATIAGGVSNLVQTAANAATIGGGNQNQVSAANAVIGGGSGNLVLGAAMFSTVGGGANNTNFGPFAIIAGGVGNLAGANAFAAGTGAQAGNQGSFVWADVSGGSLSSTNNNSVTFRAAGGYRLYSNAGATLGVFLAPNGNSWSIISDKNAKKNFAPVDGESILEKLAAIPIEQWNYKSEKDGDTPNIGPMAQDFKTAFYPGRDDKSISTLEFDGVELAAIQGLNQKLEDRAKTLEEELKQKEAEMAEMRQRLDALEKIIRGQKSN